MGTGRIVVRLDVMLARRKMTGRELAREIGFSEQKISLPRARDGSRGSGTRP